MLSHSKPSPALLLLALCGTVLSGLGGCGHGTNPSTPSTSSTSPAEQSPAQAESSSTIADVVLSDETSAKAEDEARRALTAFQQAKEAVSKQDAEAASGSLDDAHASLHALAKDRPSLLITELVWSAQGDKPAAERDFSFPVVEVPATLPEQHLELLIQDRPAFRGRSAETEKSGAPSRVAEDELIYSEVELPVVSTMMAVDIARSAVADGRWEDAAEALNRAEQAMTFVTTFSAGPLSQLRAHTWRAMAATTGGSFERAKEELQEAQRITSNLAVDETQDELVRTEAGRIQVELNTLHRALDKSTGTDFNPLLGRIGALVQHWVAIAAIDLEDVALRDELAEAIWQLDIAELWIRQGDPTDAAEPAALAEAALDEARKADSGPTTMPVLEELLAKLVAVNKLPAAERLDGYADLQGGLRDLLFVLTPPVS